MKCITIIWNERGSITYDDHKSEYDMYYYAMKEIKELLFNKNNYMFIVKIENYEDEI